jgi:hypothetical protein
LHASATPPDVRRRRRFIPKRTDSIQDHGGDVMFERTKRNQDDTDDLKGMGRDDAETRSGANRDDEDEDTGTSRESNRSGGTSGKSGNSGNSGAGNTPRKKK